MNIFGTKSKNILRPSLSYLLKRSNTSLNAVASMELRKAFQSMGRSNFVEASKIIDDLLIKLKPFRGTKDYNRVLRIHAQCYNQMRQYKDSEQIFLNILEYMKYKSTNFTPEDFLDARIDILQQFTISNQVKGLDTLNEIYQQHYKNSPVEDQALLDYYKGLYLAMDVKREGPEALEQAKKQFTYVINNYQSVLEFCVYSGHNIAVINWWEMQKEANADQRIAADAFEVISEKYDLNIKKELDKYNEIFRKSNFEANDLEGIFKPLMFSLSLVAGGKMNMFYKHPTIKNIISQEFKLENPQLFSVLLMSEILLEIRPFRETGKQLLDLVDLKTQENGVKNLSKSQVLRAAYNIDSGNLDDGVTLLKDVIKSPVYPWEDYNKLMACKFMMVVCEITGNAQEAEEMRKEVDRFTKRLPEWSSKLSNLFVPIPKFMTKNN